MENVEVIQQTVIMTTLEVISYENGSLEIRNIIIYCKKCLLDGLGI